MKLPLLSAALTMGVTRGFAPRLFASRSFQSSSLLNIAVGDAAPSVNLHSGFPPSMVDFAEYSKGKNLILVGLPGAFTPT
jgi:hypothetical protein